VPTFSVSVEDGSGASVTDGVSVSLVQNGKVIDTQASASKGGTYDFDQVIPGSYTVQVTGDGILPQNYDNVPVSTTQTTYIAFVKFGASTVSGTVTGLQGAGTGPTAMNGVLVQIGTGTDAGTFKVQKGTDGKSMATTTPTSGQGAGGYKFANVPNSPSDGWTVEFTKTGYVTSVVTGVDVNYNNAGVTLDQALTRVTHQVTVNLTLANNFPINGATANLSSSSGPTESPVSFAADPKDATQLSATFPPIPFGSWQLWVTLPSGHYGTVTTADGKTAVTSGKPLAITVSSDPAGDDTEADLALDERELDISVQTDDLPLDPTPASAPTDVELTVAGTGVSDQSFSVGAPATSIWVTPGKHQITASGLADNWSSDDPTADVTTATKKAVPVTLTELGEDVTVHVTDSKGAVNKASVTITPPSGITAPADKTTGTNGNATFSDLPFSDDQYSIAVTAGSGTTAESGSGSFTVTSTDANTVNVTIKPPP
jgi:hypothetical protein